MKWPMFLMLFIPTLAQAKLPLDNIIGCALTNQDDIQRFMLNSFTVSQSTEGKGVLVLNTRLKVTRGPSQTLGSNLVFTHVDLRTDDQHAYLHASITLPNEKALQINLTLPLYEERFRVLKVGRHSLRLKCYAHSPSSD